MKISIDEKVCLKHKMTLQEVLLALVVRNLDRVTIEGLFDNMTNREILVKLKDDYVVTHHWSDVLDEILCDSAGDEADEERLLNLAKQIRELFPAGKMKDRFGRPTPYYYRCNNSEVVKKLKKFFLQFGNYSDEEILDATKRYVSSFRGDYTNMRLVKYFILKDAVRQDENGVGHVEQVSDLASFLENRESEEEGVNTSDDWLMNSRN